MDLNKRFDLSSLNNEELEQKLHEEFMYYAEDLDELCHIIRASPLSALLRASVFFRK